MASTSQALTLPHHHSHMVASPAMNNVFSYAGYSLNSKTMRPTLRAPAMFTPSAQPQPAVGVSSFTFSQPPPAAQHLGYVNSANAVSVAGLMPYATQTPSFVSHAGMAAAAAAASGLHGVSAAYAGFPAGVAPTAAGVQAAQFMYPHQFPYMSTANFVVPQHSAGLSGATAQYSPWAAAAAAQAAAVAAAAAGSPEQPYKKLKTV